MKRKFSYRWFRSLSDLELKAERELVRRNPREFGLRWYTLLEAFDREIERRVIKQHRNDPPRPRTTRWTDEARWE